MANGTAAYSTERAKRMRLRNGLELMIKWLRKLVSTVEQLGKREWEMSGTGPIRKREG